MRSRFVLVAVIALSAAAVTTVRPLRVADAAATPTTAVAFNPNGSVIEYDSVVKARGSGPHRGGGESTAYSFFAKVPEPVLVFRKRALHPGSAIGYHKQTHDEVYYILSGRGELTLDGEQIPVGPGAAILTRPGSSHGLKQVGSEDLVLIITYPSERR